MAKTAAKGLKPNRLVTETTGKMLRMSNPTDDTIMLAGCTNDVDPTPILCSNFPVTNICNKNPLRAITLLKIPMKAVI